MNGVKHRNILLILSLDIHVHHSLELTYLCTDLGKQDVTNMFLKSKDFKLEHIPDIQLQGSKLAFVNTYVYLGHLITCDLTDDILRQRRLLCIRANMFVSQMLLCMW